MQSKANNAVLVFDNKGKVNYFKKKDSKKYALKTTMDNFKTFDGDSVQFNKAFLMNGDQKMVTTNHNDANKSLNIYDLETQQLISSFQNNMCLTDITSNQKSGPINEGNTVYASSTNGYCNLDPRIKDMKVVENIYKTVHGLNNIKTNQNGNFAISGDDGHIRLYTNITQKRAKTELPGFGDAIKEMDVSKDGSWVLATCEKYLMMVPTVLDEKHDGFTKRMGKDKPLPLKLTLTHADLMK